MRKRVQNRVGSLSHYRYSATWHRPKKLPWKLELSICAMIIIFVFIYINRGAPGSGETIRIWHDNANATRLFTNCVVYKLQGGICRSTCMSITLVWVAAALAGNGSQCRVLKRRACKSVLVVEWVFFELRCCSTRSFNSCGFVMQITPQTLLFEQGFRDNFWKSQLQLNSFDEAERTIDDLSSVHWFWTVAGSSCSWLHKVQGRMIPYQRWNFSGVNWPLQPCNPFELCKSQICDLFKNTICFNIVKQDQDETIRASDVVSQAALQTKMRIPQVHFQSLFCTNCKEVPVDQTLRRLSYREQLHSLVTIISAEFANDRTCILVPGVDWDCLS